MHIKKVFRYKNVEEVERHHSGRYGKHTRPGKRKKPTPEEMARINERNCLKKLRRKIQANFDEGDLFITLTYKAASRPDVKEARKRLRRFLYKIRNVWKKEGRPLKYIMVTEYMNKSIHHHLVLNDLPDGSGPKKVNQIWKVNGGTHCKYLYEDGQYERLAAYLVKETNKSFRAPGNPAKVRYSCSRNLKDPKPKTVKLKRDDWPEEPRVPKGWYLDKNSLVNGVDKYGYRYQYYRLIRMMQKCHPGKVNTKRKSDLKKGKKHGVKTAKNKNHV